jgi:hypothetical protein
MFSIFFEIYRRKTCLASNPMDQPALLHRLSITQPELHCATRSLARTVFAPISVSGKKRTRSCWRKKPVAILLLIGAGLKSVDYSTPESTQSETCTTLKSYQERKESLEHPRGVFHRDKTILHLIQKKKTYELHYTRRHCIACWRLFFPRRDTFQWFPMEPQTNLSIGEGVHPKNHSVYFVPFRLGK